MKGNSDGDARFWDRIARKYAADKIADLAGYERTLDRTRHFLRSGDTVLELGCGTGTTALTLAPHVSRIVATDVSSEMIAIAREKAAAQNCSNAEFAIATPDSLSWPEGSFDAVLAFNLLHLLAARPSAFAQVHRLLKPGGVFITKTFCLTEMNVLIRLAVPVMRMVGKAPYVAFFSAGELESEIEASGFTIVERARHGSGRKEPRIFLVARTAQHRRAATAVTASL
ncbi:MAG TPA: class I SAM-dependent methyltransferase [Pseudorhodoplanes sp.]|nr:class I SAM-dependent methyltransferase [Pseudorhodoplanes sp.]